MKKVLVTGGIGFLGHHLVDYLIENTDWEIIILDRIDESSNLNRLPKLQNWAGNEDRVKFVWHDLKAEINSSVYNFLEEPNIILHLAAGSHVDRSIGDPMLFVQDNIVGTCNILNYARKLPNLELFMNFSTDEIFGTAKEGQAFKEMDRYNSGNPYSATKAGAEELCVSFHNTYKMPIINTHCMNIFGERQFHEKFIPLTVKKLLNDEKIQIHCNSDLEIGSRVYMHAWEVCDAVMFVIKNGKVGEKYNIVNDVNTREFDNLTMAKMVAEIMDKELEYEMMIERGSGQGYDLRYCLDGSKLRELGWKSERSLGELLEKTINYTIENQEWI
jgi:dTDP-glucose 4,6-dehydratase